MVDDDGPLLITREALGRAIKVAAHHHDDDPDRAKAAAATAIAYYSVDRLRNSEWFGDTEPRGLNHSQSWRMVFAFVAGTLDSACHAAGQPGHQRQYCLACHEYGERAAALRASIVEALRTGERPPPDERIVAAVQSVREPRRKPKPEQRRCRECGKPIGHMRSNAAFCNDNCRANYAHKKRRREAKVTVRRA